MSDEWADASHVRLRPKVYLRGTLGEPSARYLVKWRVKKDHSRSFPVGRVPRQRDREAQSFWNRLEEARVIGVPFHVEDGLPEGMRAPSAAPSTPPDATPTVLDVACRVVAESWLAWSPGNRRSRVESLAQVVAELTTAETFGRHSRADVVRAARDRLLPPPALRMPAATEAIERAAEWLPGVSLPCHVLTLRVVEAALQRAAVKPTGGLYARDRRGQQRTSLSLVCREAVREQLLTTNPVRDARPIRDGGTLGQVAGASQHPRNDVDETRAETVEVKPSRVPSATECRALVEAVCSQSWNAWRYRAFLTLLWTTGMRPSEAAGIRNDDALHLPDEGWGWVRLTQPTVTAGQRWTGTGTAHADRALLKGRKPGVSRRVPLSPEAVAAVRDHLARAGVGPRGRVFTNSRGKPFDPSAMGKVFRAARAQLIASEALRDSLSSLTMYELRHAAASMMLREGGISVVKTAEILGNSPAVLLRTYARVLDVEDQEYQARMEAALDGRAYTPPAAPANPDPGADASGADMSTT